MTRLRPNDGCVQLSAGDMYVVPNGVEHKPCAHNDIKILFV